MELNICTINVKTLKEDENVIEMEKAIEKIKWDVIGMSEVRRLGEDIYERKSGHILYHMGTTQGSWGVGFWIHKNLKNNIQQFWGKSDRIAAVVLKLNNEKSLAIIQVYAPTKTSAAPAKRRFYDDLEEVLLELKNKSDHIIVMGDFNSEVGMHKEEDGDVTGRYGYGKRNDPGKMLVEFAKKHELYICNTFSSKRKGGRWTWRSPNGKHRGMKDYILVNSRVINEASQIETNKLAMTTDHRMVKGTLRLGNMCIKSDEDIKYESIDGLCDNVKQMLVRTFTEKEINQDAYTFQFSQKTKELIKKREVLKRQPGGKNNKEYFKIYKQVRNLIKSDIIKHEKELIERIFEESSSIKVVRKRLSNGNQWITQLRNENNEIERDRNKLTEVASDFYENFYGTKLCRKKVKLETTTDDEYEEIEDIEDKEMLIAMNSLNGNESSDGITRTMLKKGSPEVYKQIKRLLNTILQTEQIPQEWKTFVITLEYRDNSRDQISNYRPKIELTNLYKMFVTILKNRIKYQIRTAQLTEQVGYISGYSHLDHLHILTQIIERHKHYSMNVNIAFIKLYHACDHLEHAIILEALSELGVQNKYIKLVQQIHTHCVAKVKLDKEGRTFALERGVRWGDPLSQILLAVTLEKLFKNLKWEKKGIVIGNQRLSNLRFFGNIILLTDSSSELENMIRELLTQSKKVGLVVDYNETMLLSNEKPKPLNIEIEDDITLNYKDKVIYLDQVMSFKDRMDQEIDRRLARTHDVYTSLEKIFTSAISTTLKVDMFNKYIVPVLTRGAQTWTLNKKQQKRLKMKQESLLTAITKNAVNITNIGAIDVIEESKKQKWNWAERVGRMKNDRWTYMVTVWIPQNVNRRRGIAVKWSDEIENIVGEKWWCRMEDKKEWDSKKKEFIENT